MWKRFKYLACYFIVLMIFYILQKPVFMLYNGSLSKNYAFSDYLQVMFSGMKLDSTMVSYLILFPTLLICLSVWYEKLPWMKILKPYYLLIAFFIVVTFVVDMSLYSFWGFKLDATIFNYLDSPSEAFASVSIGYILLRLVIILLLIACAYWILAKIPLQIVSISRLKEKVAGSVELIILLGVFFIMIRGGFAESTSNVGRVYFSSDIFLNHSAVNPGFSFLYSLGKDQKFENEFNFFPEKERARIFDGLYPNDGELTDTLLTVKRPNVLIIEWESCGGIFIESLGGLKNVTPQFDRLEKEGIFFTNYYSNSFRTDRGTVCAFSGYLGLPTASIMKMPVKSQTLSSIAKSLSDVGYKTDFLYGGDIDFTNMRSYLLGNGYQKTTSMEDFSFKEQYSNVWGVNDDITFDWLYNQLLQRKDSLWHTGFLTLSSHEPFKVPYHRLQNEKQNSIAFTDDCLGRFIDKLKKTKIWDNLLVICIPDHSMQYEDVTVHNPMFYHTPMLWLGGAVKRPLIVRKLVNQSDLVATLMGQMGLPHKQYPFSRNVFSSSYTYPFAFSCFSNGFLFKDSTGITLFDNDAEKVLINRPDAGGQKRLERGKAILQTLYDDLGKR